MLRKDALWARWALSIRILIESQLKNLECLLFTLKQMLNFRVQQDHCVLYSYLQFSNSCSTRKAEENREYNVHSTIPCTAPWLYRNLVSLSVSSISEQTLDLPHVHELNSKVAKVEVQNRSFQRLARFRVKSEKISSTPLETPFPYCWIATNVTPHQLLYCICCAKYNQTLTGYT